MGKARVQLVCRHLNGGPFSPPLTETFIAIGLTLLSSLLYLVGYSLSRLLVVEYGMTALQVTFLRCAIVLAVIAMLLPFSPALSLRRVLRPARPWTQRSAAALLIASNALAVIGYSLMQVTAASAIGFVAPLLLAVLFTLVQTAALGSIAAALRRGEASRLAPWQFSGLLWAMMLDALMFDKLQSAGSLVGAGLIVGGGLVAQAGALRRQRTGVPRSSV